MKTICGWGWGGAEVRETGILFSEKLAKILNRILQSFISWHLMSVKSSINYPVFVLCSWCSLIHVALWAPEKLLVVRRSEFLQIARLLDVSITTCFLWCCSIVSERSADCWVRRGGRWGGERRGGGRAPGTLIK
jgi:hypothetical protein